MAVRSGASDPLRNYNFTIDIDGINTAAFQRVSGLKMKTEVGNYRDGGDNTIVHRLPGQTSYEPITLERGITTNKELYTWATKVYQLNTGTGSDDFRKTIYISLKDRTGTIKRKWAVYNAWISDYSTGEMNATANDVLLESVVLEHEGFEEVA